MDPPSPAVFRDASRGLISTVDNRPVFPMFRAKSWAAQHALTTASNPFRDGVTLFSNSWPKAPVPTVTGEPIDIGPPFTTKS
jgi:hypothetical protein